MQNLKKLLTWKFWKVRLLMFLWGFISVYWFTGSFKVSFGVFIMQALGNTIIMLLL